MEWEEVIKIFVAGITLGTGPCLLICLPILLPYISAKGTDWRGGFKLALIFSLSRLVSYSLLGLLAVVLFRVVNTLLGPQGGYFKLTAGIFVVSIGIIYLLPCNITKAGACKFLHKYLIEKSNLNMFTLGVLIGFSPCAPLTAILTYIASMAKNALWGLLSGFFFWAGNVYFSSTSGRDRCWFVFSIC
ncbi:MAG TPA: sulfite exporter TauE/SafE family protein [Candidatus Omnitrophica bacterium]|nr:sulfite exporter TauE/SafE family protein [Candidatus Omnitrophota bacterium]